MTKREMFTAMLAIPAIADNAEMTEFINHEIELLVKKAVGSRSTAVELEIAVVHALDFNRDFTSVYFSFTATEACH